MFLVPRGLAIARMVALTGGLVASAAGPAIAQTTPIFRMNMSANAWPNMGWPSGSKKTEEVGRRYTETLLQGAGPSGQNVVRFTQLYAPSLEAYGGQYSFGWENQVDTTNPGYGVTRYYRWRMRVTADSNGYARNWSDGSQTSSTVKVLIAGSGGTCRSGDHCRFIGHFEMRRSDGRIQFRVGTDADIPQEGNTGYLWNKGEWLNVQIGIRTSSSYGRTDGWLRAWINNNTFSAPNMAVANQEMNAISFANIGLGIFMNSGLASDGVFKTDYADFEVDDEFHSGWSAGSGSGGAAPPPPTTPPPTPPSNLRLLTSSTIALGSLRGLQLFVRRRRDDDDEEAGQ